MYRYIDVAVLASRSPRRKRSPLPASLLAGQNPCQRSKMSSAAGECKRVVVAVPTIDRDAHLAPSLWENLQATVFCHASDFGIEFDLLIITRVTDVKTLTFWRAIAKAHSAKGSANGLISASEVGGKDHDSDSEVGVGAGPFLTLRRVVVHVVEHYDIGTPEVPARHCLTALAWKRNIAMRYAKTGVVSSISNITNHAGSSAEAPSSVCGEGLRDSTVAAAALLFVDTDVRLQPDTFARLWAAIQPVEAVLGESDEGRFLRCPSTDPCPQCALATGQRAADVAFAPYAPSWDPEGRPVVALTHRMAQGRCEYDSSHDDDCGSNGHHLDETDTSEIRGAHIYHRKCRRVGVILTVNPHMRCDGIYSGTNNSIIKRPQVFAAMGGAIGASLVSHTAFDIEFQYGCIDGAGVAADASAHTYCDAVTEGQEGEGHKDSGSTSDSIEGEDVGFFLSARRCSPPKLVVCLASHAVEHNATDLGYCSPQEYSSADRYWTYI